MSEDKASLLILKANSNSFKGQEVFLRNREWPFAVTADVTEFVALMAKNQYQIVMIPTDHPNKMVRRLPRLMTEIFACCLIAYSEANTNQAIMALHEWNLKYSLYPPVSGPSILRLISKIQREFDRQEALERIRQRAALAKQAGGGNATLDAEALLAQLVPSDEGGSGSAAIGYRPEAQEPGVKKSAVQLIQRAGSESAQVVPQDQASLDQLEEMSREVLRAGFLPVANEVVAEPNLRPVKDSDIPLMDALQDALESSRILGSEPGAHDVPIESVSRVACLALNASNFRGYLVVAMGADRLVDDEFLRTLQTRLMDFSKFRGLTEPLSGEALLPVRVRPVGFLPWAKSQAQFLLNSVSGGREVALAFFPAPTLDVAVKDSAEKHMVKIPISEIEPSAVLEFDVFLHLPNNAKYILYNKKGRTMFAEQKSRLVRLGVSEVHLKREAVPEIRKYKAQNFLNDKIREFLRQGQAS